MLTRDEDAHRVLFPYTYTDFYLLYFGKGEKGQRNSVTWKHDLWVMDGEKLEQIGTDEHQTTSQAQI